MKTMTQKTSGKKGEFERFLAIFMSVLIITLPVYTANAFAAITFQEVHINGGDGKESFRKETDATTIRVKINSHSPVLPTFLEVMNDSRSVTRNSPGTARFSQCTTANPYECSITLPLNKVDDKDRFSVCVNLANVEGRADFPQSCDAARPAAQQAGNQYSVFPSILVDKRGPTVERFTAEPTGVSGGDVGLTTTVVDTTGTAAPGCVGLAKIKFFKDDGQTLAENISAAPPSPIACPANTTTFHFNADTLPNGASTKICAVPEDAFGNVHPSYVNAEGTLTPTGQNCLNITKDNRPPTVENFTAIMDKESGKEIAFLANRVLEVQVYATLLTHTHTVGAVKSAVAAFNTGTPEVTLSCTERFPVPPEPRDEQSTDRRFDCYAPVMLNPDGDKTRTFTLAAEDAAKNKVEASKTLTFQIDDVPPVVREITATRVFGGVPVLGPASNTLIAVIDETGAGISKETVLINNKKPETCIQPEAGAFLCNSTIGSVQSDTVSITVRGKDLADNKMEEGTADILVDKDAPVFVKAQIISSSKTPVLPAGGTAILRLIVQEKFAMADDAGVHNALATIPFDAENPSTIKPAASCQPFSGVGGASPPAAQPTPPTSDSPPPASDQLPAGTTTFGGGSQTHRVSIAGSTFTTPSLSVAAGDTVVWTNNDNFPHTVTADDGSFSLDVAAGQTVQRTFSAGGNVPYHCNIHPDMHASVSVHSGLPTGALVAVTGQPVNENLPNLWQCDWEIFNLKSNADFRAVFTGTKDVAGNTLVRDGQAAVVVEDPFLVYTDAQGHVHELHPQDWLGKTVLEGLAPAKYIITPYMMSPVVDARGAAVATTAVFFDLSVTPEAGTPPDVKPVAVDVTSCSGEDYESGAFAQEATKVMFSTAAPTKATLRFNLRPGKIPETKNKYVVSCEFSIMSQKGNKVSGVTKVTAVMEIPLGNVKDISDGVWDEIVDHVEDNNLMGTFVTKVNKVISFLTSICSILQGLAAVSAAVAAVHAVILGLSDAFPLLKPLEQAVNSVSGFMTGFTEFTQHKYLQTACNFLTCQWTPTGSLLSSFGIEQPSLDQIGDTFKKARKEASSLDPRKQTETQWTAFANPRGSLYLSYLTLCIPGIFENLQRRRVVECSYISCLYSQVGQGMPKSTCDRVYNYEVCKIETGELLALIPFAHIQKQLAGMIKQFITSPVTLVGATMNIICKPIIKAPVAEGHARTACNFLYLPFTIMRVVDSISTIIENVKGMFNPPADACEDILKKIKDDPRFAEAEGRKSSNTRGFSAPAAPARQPRPSLPSLSPAEGEVAGLSD